MNLLTNKHGKCPNKNVSKQKKNEEGYRTKQTDRLELYCINSWNSFALI